MQSKPVSYSPNTLVDILNSNKSKKVAVSKIIDSNPQALPILPKLVADTTDMGKTADDDNLRVNRAILETIHKQIQTNRLNNKNIIKLFPDVELAIQILVSSILSPKKMMDIKLRYKLDKKLPLSPEVASAILKCVQTYVTETHELEDKLPEIVREALFTSGSYCMAVVPEASVDAVINSDLIASFSTESFSVKAEQIVAELTDSVNIESAGLTAALPTGDNLTAESFVKHLASEEFVKVTDNAGLFRFADMKEQITEKLLKRSYRNRSSVAMEAREKIQYLDIFRRRRVDFKRSDITMLKKRDENVRKSVGSPMVVRIPSESVVPVSIPGNETEHTGYLVVMDENGKPLNTESAFSDATGATRTMANLDTGANQSPVQIAYKNLISDNSAKVNVGELFNMYKDILERQFYTNIRGSLYGKNISIANKNDIYYLMFTRALAGQKTNVLFIPKELMTYFAFYYDECGVGKSILDNLSILCSLRSILLFSKVMAYSKQAIDVTKVTIDLSPEDPDPEKTIAMVQDGVLKLRQNFFPLGINNPVDLINWIQRAGLQFAYNNNPLIPDVKIDFENANLTHTVPNSELEETLRKQTFQALGLPPETIDNAFSPEFATNVVNNNILLSKRVAVYQKPLCKSLSKLVGSFVYNDEELRDKLRAIIDKNADTVVASLGEDMRAEYAKSKDNFIDSLLDSLSEHIRIELPKPENTNMTNLATEFDIYKTGLEAVVDIIVSAEIFSEDIAGTFNQHADTMKNLLKTHLLKQWCSDNNYYPEALAFGKKDLSAADRMIALMTSSLSGTMRNSSLLLNMMKKIKEAMEKDLSGIDGAGGSSMSGGDASGGGDRSGGDFGGGDESLDFGGDGGGEENSSEEGSADDNLDESLNF